MKRSGLALVFLMLLALYSQAEVIDRIVAIVNGNLIMLSDVDQEARLEAFIGGQSFSKNASSELNAVLQRMIDRELLHEQMRGVRSMELTSTPVDRRLRDLRNSLGSTTQSDEGWQKALTDAGITEQQLREHYADQVQTLRFLEARLRPRLQVDNAAIEKYYRETFVPQLQKAGQSVVPLADVSRRIRDILIEQELDESLTKWLESLRDQSDIEMMKPMEAQSAGNK